MDDSPRKESSEQLDREKLIERLRISSPDLVEELYKTSKDYLASETVRENNLNAKATSLLTASGLSLTVAFTFGGLLLQHPEYHGSLCGLWPYIVPILYGLALLSGLSASAVALWALLIRDDYTGVDDKDVFNSDLLREAERLDFASLPEPALNIEQTEQEDSPAPTEDLSGDVIPRPPAPESNGSADQSEAASEEFVPQYPKSGTAYYRRFMTVHFWLIARKHFDIHEAKAKRIGLGQKLFFVFLLFLAAIGFSLTAVAIIQQNKLAEKHQQEESSKNQQSTAQQHTNTQPPTSGPDTQTTIPSATEPSRDKIDEGMSLAADDGGTIQKARRADENSSQPKQK